MSRIDKGNGALRIDAGETYLERRTDGRLWLSAAGRAPRPVRAVPCFPWSDPMRNVSLRDDDDNECALIADPVELDDESRRVLTAALVEAGFVLEIEKVEAVREEVEIRVWQVVTRQGPRQFSTPTDAWPHELPGGSLLIRDVGGDLYVIRDPSGLDASSQRQLWAFAN